MKAKRFLSSAILALSVMILAIMATAGCGKNEKSGGEIQQVTVPKESGCLIEITSTGIPDDQKDCKLSKKMRPNEDHVRWTNNSGQKITVRFKTAWPFTGTGAGAGMDIVIEAGEASPWYTISQTVTYGQYFYELVPSPTGTPPPTEPSVSAEP